MKRHLIGLILTALPALGWSNSVEQLQTELDQQKFARAATTGLALLRQQPDNIRVMFLTALALQNNGQPEQAARYYRQIITMNPSLPEPHNNLAMIEMTRGNHDQAANLLIASLQTHPAYATAWQNLSNLYQGLASEAYRRALSEDDSPGKVTDNIQLVALNTLHNPPAEPPAAETSVTVAQAPTPAMKPAAKAKPSSVKIISKKTVALKPLPPAATDEMLVALVNDWASAWSSKDFSRYINAYSDDFKGRQQNHRAWIEHRRTRIERPGYINVQLSNIHIKSRSSNRAVIDFHQAFQSPNYRDKVAKRIVLDRRGERWLISSEKTLAVL